MQIFEQRCLNNQILHNLKYCWEHIAASITIIGFIIIFITRPRWVVGRVHFWGCCWKVLLHEEIKCGIGQSGQHCQIKPQNKKGLDHKGLRPFFTRGTTLFTHNVSRNCLFGFNAALISKPPSMWVLKILPKSMHMKQCFKVITAYAQHKWTSSQSSEMR